MCFRKQHCGDVHRVHHRQHLSCPGADRSPGTHAGRYQRTAKPTPGRRGVRRTAGALPVCPAAGQGARGAERCGEGCGDAAVDRWGQPCRPTLGSPRRWLAGGPAADLRADRVLPSHRPRNQLRRARRRRDAGWHHLPPAVFALALALALARTGVVRASRPRRADHPSRHHVRLSQRRSSAGSRLPTSSRTCWAAQDTPWRAEARTIPIRSSGVPLGP